jgi:hypothetical protein
LDVDHGFVDVFAYQEALIIEAIFGIALLVMIWAGFRRWLQYKERMGQVMAHETAERAAQFGAHMELVEARLNTIEQMVIEGNVAAAAQIDAPGTNLAPDPVSKGDEV